VGPHATPGARRDPSRITEDVFTTGLDADYAAIDAACDDVLAQVADADEVRVTSPAGTDITFGIGDREWLADTGMVHEPGDFSNLPAGEVFISPETATGTYVVDGTMMPYGLLDEDQTLTFEVEDGLVTSVSDDAVREELETAAESVGDAAYNLAELGIGTNVGVDELVGSVLLDEKAGGTVHHRDRRQRRDRWRDRRARPPRRNPPKPTVYVDGEAIELPSA